MRGLRFGRALPTILIICTVFFIVREPTAAADTATKIYNWLTTVADALVVFAGALD